MINDNELFDTPEFKSDLKKYEDAQKAGQSIYLDVDQFYDIADFYQWNDKIGKAYKAIDEGLFFFPDSVTLWVLKAKYTYLYDKDIKKANLILSHITDISDIEYILMKGELLLAENKIKAAEKLFKQSFNSLYKDVQEDFIESIIELYTFYNFYDEAQLWFNKIKKADAPYYKEMQGKIFMGKGNLKESEAIFKELLDENPYSSDYWNEMAALQLQQNNYSDVIISCDFALAINPNDSEAIIQKANALTALGNNEEAIKLFDKYIALKPNEALVELLKSMAYSHMNKLKDALISLKQAEKKSKNESSELTLIYYEMAFAYSRLGNLPKALDCIKKRSKISKDNPIENSLLKGHIYLKHNKVEEATICFFSAIQLSNEDASTYHLIALIAFDCDYLELAYDMFEIYYDVIDKNVAENYSIYAFCCKELHKDDKYIDAVEMACKKEPEDTKDLLGEYFPIDLPVEQYAAYLRSQKNTIEI